MTMLTDYREQVKQFKAELYKAGIASKQEIFANQDLVEEALHLAKEGVPVQLYNQKPLLWTSMTEVTAATNAVDGTPHTPYYT